MPGGGESLLSETSGRLSDDAGFASDREKTWDSEDAGTHVTLMKLLADAADAPAKLLPQL